jgi:outer membrane biogenesis lipoprotein LolB
VKPFLLVPLVLLILLACSKTPEPVPDVAAVPEIKKEEQYGKELEEIKRSIRGDIKIKLKKDGKGDYYSWEISGKDASEVLKANDILTKKLSGGPPAKKLE